MKNKYLNNFINQFINFTAPQGKSAFIVTEKNIEKLLRRKKNYDYIFLINTLEKENDILSLLHKLSPHLSPKGRLIIIYRNYLYSFIRGLFKSILRINPTHDNWLSTKDILNFLKLTHYEFLFYQPLCFTPDFLPFLSELMNRFFIYFFPFNHLSYLHYVIATPRNPLSQNISTSIIVPARNEEGNIKNIFRSLTQVGKKTEIVFVEGHSKDNTREEIQKYIKKYKAKHNLSYKLIIQKHHHGKADAVNIGFKHAKNDIFIIYDSDMTIKPHDLHKFYEALISGDGDFINGSRLVYPIQTGAMQFLNILGNKLFSLLYSWLFGQPIKDTLCGTKALWRKDYLLFNHRFKNLSSLDPFGDFYLLYGAARLNLKINDLPVRYYARSYGATNISRFKNAWQLFKFSLFVFKNYKMRL